MRRTFVYPLFGAFDPPELMTSCPRRTQTIVPTQALTWSLLSGAPPAALFSPANGHITWQTGPADSGTTRTFALVVTDNGSPNLSATQSFNVVVTHTNHAPAIVGVPPQISVDEQTTLSLPLSATDPDASDTLTWQSGSSLPSGLNLDSVTGLLTWTPSEAQGPGAYVVTVIVRDNGTPALSDTNTFVIVVNEVNRPPVLSAISNQVAFVLEPLVIASAASDPDIPANSLHFSFGSGAPARSGRNGSGRAIGYD